MKRKSGLADSPFFFPPPPAEAELSSAIVFPQTESDGDITIPSHQDISVSSNHGIVVSRYQNTTIECVRKSVKEFGKEAATYRFTLTEKRALANIIHSLHMQGIRTTENEITRVAINFIIEEFNQQEKNSPLGLVLQALKK